LFLLVVYKCRSLFYTCNFGFIKSARQTWSNCFILMWEFFLPPSNLGKSVDCSKSIWLPNSDCTNHDINTDFVTITFITPTKAINSTNIMLLKSKDVKAVQIILLPPYNVDLWQSRISILIVLSYSFQQFLVKFIKKHLPICLTLCYQMS